MEISFEYKDASEKMKIISSLTEEDLRLTDDYRRMREIGEHKKANEIGLKKNQIKSKLRELRDSIEYIELRIFCQVMKTYLTKSQYIEAWERVREIATHPEVHLKKSNK